MTMIRNSEAAQAMDLLDRPLSARSLIASLLLGMRTPRRSAAELVRWCELFGVASGTARVALSRMVDAGELQNDGAAYELVGRLRARNTEHDVATDPQFLAWSGQWLLAVVTVDARTPDERTGLRSEMRANRYAELREGLWTRPDNLVGAPMPFRDAQCRLWRAAPVDDPGDTVEALFGCESWAGHARRLLGETRRLTADTHHADGQRTDTQVRDAFVVSTAVLAHLRRDPLLPDALVGPDWPGPALRTAYRECARDFRLAARTWFAANS